MTVKRIVLYDKLKYFLFIVNGIAYRILHILIVNRPLYILYIL